MTGTDQPREAMAGVIAKKLKPYPRMKDSCVEWLGEVPAHWEIWRTKFAFLRIVGGSTPSSNETRYWDRLGTGYVWVTPTDVSRTTRLKSSQRRLTQEGLDSCSAELLAAGSIVISSRAPVGNVSLVEVPFCTNQGCKALTPNWNKIDSLFALYLFKTLKAELQSLANGTTFTEISTNNLGNVMQPLPPLPEQTAIVRYLDYVDRRVRRLTRAKRKLVALLKEQKQAIIHRAVTRGLDPNAHMKDSGVEWLGEVPSHWKVRPLKTSISGLINGVWGSEPNGVEDFPCVRVADFDRKKLRVHSPIPTMRAISPSEHQGRMLKPGDLLLEKSGGGDQQKVGVVIFFDHDIEAVCSNFIARVSIKSEFNSEYLVFLHAALYAIGLNQKSIKQTTGIQNLDSTAYFAELVAFPPLPEQTAIAKYLDKVTADIDAAIDRTRRQIELLNEYRTRLIADVVTGKVKVPGISHD